MPDSKSMVLYRGVLRVAVADPRYRSGIIMEQLEVRRVLSAVAGDCNEPGIDQPEIPAIIVDDPGDGEVWTFGGIDENGDPAGSEDGQILIDDGGIADTGMVDDNGEVIDDGGDGSVIDDDSDGSVIDDNGDPADGTTDDGQVVDVPVTDDGGPIYYAMGGGQIELDQRGAVLTSTGASTPASNQGNEPVQVAIPVEKFAGVPQQGAGDFSVLVGSLKKNVTDDGSNVDLPFLN